MIDDIINALEHEVELAKDIGDVHSMMINIGVIKPALDLIKNQKAEIRELKREIVDGKRDIEKIAMKYFAREEELERQKLEIDILIRKKDNLRDEIAEKDAEIERLHNILNDSLEIRKGEISVAKDAGCGIKVEVKFDKDCKYSPVSTDEIVGHSYSVKSTVSRDRFYHYMAEMMKGYSDKELTEKNDKG